MADDTTGPTKEQKDLAQETAEIQEKNRNEERSFWKESKDFFSTQKGNLQFEREQQEIRQGMLEKEIDALKEKKRSAEGLEAGDKERLEAKEKGLKLEKETNKELEARQGLADGLAGSLTNMLSMSTGFNANWKDSTIVGKFSQAHENGQSFSSTLNDVASSALETINPMGILANAVGAVFDKTMMMVLATDQTMASFNAATGFAGKYNEEIFAATEATAELGIGMAETGQAAGALAQSMSSFTSMAPAARGEAIALAAGMDKIGFGAENSGKAMDIAMKGFGMSLPEAKKMTLELAGAAQALGISQQQMGADFNSSMKELAKYGPEGVDVFKKLAAASKEAGVEMGTLMSVAGKFDTIQGSAEAAGELNAILGGNLLNSMELLNATEEERIRMLVQSVQQSGRSWESMDRFERQAVANAAGISDMTEANNLFGMSLDAYDQNAEKALEASMSQEELAEATKAATSMGEKFSTIMERMAVSVMWIVDGINVVLDLFLEWGTVGAWVLTSVIPLALWGLLKMIQFFTKKVGKAFGEGIGKGIETMSEGAATGIKTVGKAVSDTMNKMAPAVKTFGEAAKKTWPSILALGAAFLMMGAGVFLVAYGMSLLVKSFADLTGAQIAGVALALLVFIGVVAILAVTLYALVVSGALPAAALGLMALGAAFLMMGAGVMLAALGMKLFAEGILSLLPAIPDIFALGGALLHLLGALVALAAVGLPVAVGLSLIGAGLAILGVGLALVGGFWLFAEAVLLLVPHSSSLIIIGGAFLMMGAGAALLGVFGVLAGVGLAAMAYGLLAIAASLLFIKTEDLWALGNIMTGMAAMASELTILAAVGGYLQSITDSMISEEDAWALYSLVDAVDALADALDRLNEPALTAMGAFFLSLQGLTLELADTLEEISDSMWSISMASFFMDADALQGMGDVFQGLAVAIPAASAPGAVEAVEKIVEASSKIEPARATGLMDMIARAYGFGGPDKPTAGAGAGGAGGNTIILKVDGRELGRAVTKSLNEVNNLSLG